jgi:hypothetical protein
MLEHKTHVKITVGNGTVLECVGTVSLITGQSNKSIDDVVLFNVQNSLNMEKIVAVNIETEDFEVKIPFPEFIQDRIDKQNG